MKRNAFWNLIDKAGQRTFVILSFVNAILGFVFLCAYGEKGVVLSSVDNYEKQYREERIVPPLIEGTGIENCLIKQVSFEETHFMIKADPSRYAEITEAVFPLLDKTYERDARFILEFDHDSESRGLTVCLIRDESHELKAWRTPAFWNNTAE